METNLKVHVQFGYDYFYIGYNKKRIFGNSSCDGILTKDLGSFSDEYDLKEKIGKVKVSILIIQKSGIANFKIRSCK